MDEEIRYIIEQECKGVKKEDLDYAMIKIGELLDEEFARIEELAYKEGYDDGQEEAEDE